MLRDEYLGMETEATVQVLEERGVLEEDWAEAEWFQEWLRLARHEYKGANLSHPSPAATRLGIDNTSPVG